MLRTLAALLLLAIVVLVGLRLGNWQLNRATERLNMAATIAAGRASTPLQLNAHTAAPELSPWRSASANGTWLHQYTILVDNRNHDGRPGYWVATPLLLAQDSDATGAQRPPAALLVLRGWMPRPVHPGQAQQPIPAPTGIQTVHGELLERVPRLLQLWSWSKSSTGQLPATWSKDASTPVVVQNLDLNELSQASGLQLLPTVLAANPDPGSGLLQEWPEPPLDADKNRGYAVQWFGFAAIAGIAWIIVLWRALKRQRQRRSDTI